MRSAAQLVYSACITSDDCDVSEGPGGGNGFGNSIELEGEKVTLAYGYPRNTDTAGIARAAQIAEGDYYLTDFTSGGTDGLRVRPGRSADPNECEVRYIQPQSAGGSPSFEMDVAGC